ncbi:MAG: phosphate ABC transporter permease PstA [Halobacteriales archaeon]|nr:phosphate ABC transporter permease PstA [Halobacteriales archaeon]
MGGGPSARSYAVEGFGQVSRRVGRLFQALLLSATLVGIVSLAILLALVAYDALQPQTADPGWYVTFLGAFVLPTATAVWIVRTRTPRGVTVGSVASGIPVLGLLFGSGLAVLFVEVVPPVGWLGFLVALALPLALTMAVERRRGVPFVPKLVGVTVAFAASLSIVPGIVARSPVLPADWLILVVTMGGPAAAATAWIVARRWPDGSTGRIAGVATFALVFASGAAGPAIGLGRVPAVVLSVTTALPTGLFVAAVLRDDPIDRLGLAIPLVAVLGILGGAVVTDVVGFAGPASWVDWQFVTSNHNNDPTQAGVYPAMVGSIMLMIIVALVSFPLGIGAAVYLEEYAPDNRLTRVIDVNISNLAGVPSVVYGLLGLGLFITYFDAKPGTVLVGGFTLALLILPIVIISAREAVRSVPDGLRDASYGMGATRWQTIKNVVLPEAFPGILTGTILALGRAIGETAPLLVIGAPQVFDLPSDLSARVGALPLQIFVWATTFASPDFYEKALPAGVIVLLVILLTMNSAAIVLRNRFEREA